jgi:DNA-binding NarL/FixJ family response regulator
VIRIFAIFKSSIFTTALEPFLRSNGIDIVSSCNNSSVAIGHYNAIKPDIVMMDLNWTDTNYSVSGNSLIDQLKQQNPRVRIIGVTNFFDPRTVTNLKDQAVQGYFYRCMDNLLEGVKECVETVYEGERFYAKAVVGQFASKIDY